MGHSIAESLPELVRHEGVWEGTYTTSDCEGNFLDRHRSRLTCRFDGPEYRQRNEYAWDDGRTVTLDFTFALDGDRLVWSSDRTKGGLVWQERRAGTLGSMRLVWSRNAHEGYSPFDLAHCEVHEMIQLDASGTHRARVWQWFRSGELIQRTLIKERRTA